MLLFLFLTSLVSKSQTPESNPQYSIEVYYDSRFFLSNSESFKLTEIYPSIDDVVETKNWDWNDVDPLALFTPDENRLERRKRFLFDYDSSAIQNSTPSDEQLKFCQNIKENIPLSMILLDKSNFKIVLEYTISYKDNLPIENLLKKLSELGLQWSEVGGNNLYIYNGCILIGMYKIGKVVACNLDIDKPFKKQYKTNKNK